MNSQTWQYYKMVQMIHQQVQQELITLHDHYKTESYNKHLARNQCKKKTGGRDWSQPVMCILVVSNISKVIFLQKKSFSCVYSYSRTKLILASFYRHETTFYSTHDLYYINRTFFSQCCKHVLSTLSFITIICLEKQKK